MKRRGCIRAVLEYLPLQLEASIYATPYFLHCFDMTWQELRQYIEGGERRASFLDRRSSVDCDIGKVCDNAQSSSGRATLHRRTGSCIDLSLLVKGKASVADDTLMATAASADQLPLRIQSHHDTPVHCAVESSANSSESSDGSSAAAPDDFLVIKQEGHLAHIDGRGECCLHGLGESFFYNVLHLRDHGIEQPLAFVSYNVLHKTGIIKVCDTATSVMEFGIHRGQ